MGMQRVTASFLFAGVACLSLACSSRSGPTLEPVTGDDAGGRADAGAPADAGRCNDSTGMRDPACDPGGEPPLGVRPPLPRDCAPGTEWVYAIGLEMTDPTREGRATHLLRFEPDTMRVVDLGVPSCDITPFSMSVDRTGTAWVLSHGFGSGDSLTDGLYRVDTTTLECSRVAGYVVNQGGWQVFAMGFVADARDAATETLFLVGGPKTEVDAGRNLFGFLHRDTMTIESLARVEGSPELTGTGEGSLWGFFPKLDVPVVARIDRVTGALGDAYPVGVGGRGGAWAMGFWGGDFYVFWSGDVSAPSAIYRLSTRTGRFYELVPDVGFLVSGAGVSTCAPYELI